MYETENIEALRNKSAGSTEEKKNEKAAKRIMLRIKKYEDCFAQERSLNGMRGEIM